MRFSFERGPGRARRGRLVGAFLATTLLLALWLGYEAVDAAREHRRTAESVLRDYAEISLASFSRSVTDDLDDFLDEAFDHIDGELRGWRRLPDPDAIDDDLEDAAREAGCRECGKIQSPLLLFTADVETGRVRSSPDSVSDARILGLARTIVERRPDISRYDEGVLTAPRQSGFGGSVAVGYAVARNERGRARVMAFVVTADALAELFAERFRERQLLPDPIGGDLPNDSLLQVTVRAPDGRPIYRSPVDYPSTLSASRRLGPESGAMSVEVAIRPDQASQLIIGGLPNSRLPLLVTLLILTLGVGAAALVQFRQEARFQRLRDDFVSGVSHELRTPLAQIRMFAELQDMDKLSAPEDRRRAIAIIHREARRLSHLVENILQFSRLRHPNEVAMPMEEVDFADALEEGVDAMSSLLHDRAMSLRFDAEPGLRVRANRDAVTRVVVNLLDNAAKYGPRGQEVSVDVRRVNGNARLSVRDQGPGVPAADRRRIWQAYRRLERDVKARIPGTGIGLSVVAELVSIHGGRVWVDGEEDGGTNFVVELPLAGDGIRADAPIGHGAGTDT
ncbi:MAG: sensor histidine kinase [Longimicrobiales bacterium]